MKKTSFSFLILCVLITKFYGQEQRTFTFDKEEVTYFFFSNMASGLTKFPNHKAKFIVVSKEKSLLNSSKSNKIFDDEMAKNDKTIYYYFKIPKLKNDKSYLKFVKKLIEETYNKDFFDRNTTSLDFQDNTIPFSCDILDELNTVFSKISVSENNNLSSCNATFVVTKNLKSDNLKTSIRYYPVSTEEAERNRKNYTMINQLHNWKSNFFISVTLGNHTIDNNYITSFDEETLVDISSTNAIWNISSGYLFTNKIGGLMSFSLMTSKDQTTSFNGISVSGSGNGFGVFKYGIGVRYIPFAKKRWSIYGDLQGGSLNIRAEGGTGSGTIFGVSRDITKKSERSNYIGFAAGANYRLGKTVYLTSNLEYTKSDFETDIGSISGFTGYTINAGIGFSF